MLEPPPLAPGDTIAVFAGSSAFDRAPVLRGMGWLAERFRVVFEPSLFSRSGYLAGPDERRAAELARWMREEGVSALLAARGGWGLLRVIDALPWAELARRPRWILGFSDVTTLHLELAARGVASLHGPNASGLAAADEWTRARVLSVLLEPAAPYRLEGVAWQGGRARGPLVGGNLTLLHAHAAAGRLRLPPGAILLLEDVTERPYRIDRMLTALALSGALEGVAGFALGEWTDCAPGRDGVTVERVLRDALAPLGRPIVAGLPIGHGRYNAPVVLGREHVIDGASLSSA
ncbi:MAG: LD-carboxypeptidase [Polyangiaceae bacterium]|nr:LD-carboxypeptidase [Polyangiaceae bacterium]